MTKLMWWTLFCILFISGCREPYVIKPDFKHNIKGTSCYMIRIEAYQELHTYIVNREGGIIEVKTSRWEHDKTVNETFNHQNTKVEQ